jgi:hypothetical protein
MNTVTKKNVRLLCIVAIVALLAACVPATVAHASAPTWYSWPDTTFKGKSKAYNIGYGLKAQATSFSGQSDKDSGVAYLDFSIKISGTAKKQGIYSLAVYYKGKRVKDIGTDVYGSEKVSFGVVKGKVKPEYIYVRAYIADGGKIDRSKFKIKRTGFISGYRLDVSTGNTKAEYNGLKARIYDVVAPKDTGSKVLLRPCINGKGGYIARRNTAVRFYLYGAAYSTKGAEQTAVMTATVTAGGKILTAGAIVEKGNISTGNISVPTDLIYPYPPKIGWPRNWATDTVKITGNTSARISSVSVSPISQEMTGSGIVYPLSDGVGIVLRNGGSYDSDVAPDGHTGFSYEAEDGKAYFVVDLGLTGAALTKAPVLHEIGIKYTGDSGNIILSKSKYRFVTTDKYKFDSDYEGIYLKIQIKDIMKPTVLDLTKFSFSGGEDRDYVKLRCARLPWDEDETIAEKSSDGVLVSLDMNDAAWQKTPAVYTPDEHLFTCVKKGTAQKLEINAYGDVKKTGTIKYTVKANGKVLKSGKFAVRKGEEYSKRLKTFKYAPAADTTFSVTTKYIK